MPRTTNQYSKVCTVQCNSTKALWHCFRRKEEQPILPWSKIFRQQLSCTWLDFAAELINIVPASFCQQHIIPEIRDLHLFEVEHLISAFLGFNLIALLSQAAQHLAATGLVSLTHVGTQAVRVSFACFSKLEVEAVVLAGPGLISLYRLLALGGHVCCLCVVLQAPADPTQVHHSSVQKSA